MFLSSQKLVRLLAVAAAFAFGILLLPGCDERYSKDMTYPVRTDKLVTQDPPARDLNTEGRPTLDTPGQFAYLLSSFAEKYPKNLLDPMKLSAEQRGQFERVLNDLFGTPAEPKVDLAKAFKNQSESDLSTNAATALKDLQLDKDTLAEGSKLYRRYCLYCHGLSGDGHGPTAAWVNPHPRDFRPGKFKFMSSQGGNARKPRREDLLRTLRQGVEGTAMPPFGLLPEKDLQALASYVIHLSVRGQAEYDVMRDLLTTTEKRNIESSIYENVAIKVAGTQGWWESNNNPIVPEAFPYDEPMSEAVRHASIRKGLKVFQTACIECHKDYGRRNNYIWDDWGTVVRPADLTVNTYRGGRRPVDLYWRIRGGIGTYMPKSSESTWDVVNFVQALPYPNMLPEEVRKEIYESAK